MFSNGCDDFGISLDAFIEQEKLKLFGRGDSILNPI
jgi:hypothetical protein